MKKIRVGMTKNSLKVVLGMLLLSIGFCLADNSIGRVSGEPLDGLHGISVSVVDSAGNPSGYGSVSLLPKRGVNAIVTIPVVLDTAYEVFRVTASYSTSGPIGDAFIKNIALGDSTREEGKIKINYSFSMPDAEVRVTVRIRPIVKSIVPYGEDQTKATDLTFSCKDNVGAQVSCLVGSQVSVDYECPVGYTRYEPAILQGNTAITAVLNDGKWYFNVPRLSAPAIQVLAMCNEVNYTATTNTTDHCSLKWSASTFKYGENLTFTTECDEGYSIASVGVKTKSGAPVNYTEANGTYTVSNLKESVEATITEGVKKYQISCQSNLDVDPSEYCFPKSEAAGAIYQFSRVFYSTTLGYFYGAELAYYTIGDDETKHDFTRSSDENYLEFEMPANDVKFHLEYQPLYELKLADNVADKIESIHSTMAFSDKLFMKGGVVTFSAVSGAEFENIKVINHSAGCYVNFTEKDGTYSFVMPGNGVIIQDVPAPVEGALYALYVEGEHVAYHIYDSTETNEIVSAKAGDKVVFKWTIEDGYGIGGNAVSQKTYYLLVDADYSYDAKSKTFSATVRMPADSIVLSINAIKLYNITAAYNEKQGYASIVEHASEGSSISVNAFPGRGYELDSVVLNVDGGGSKTIECDNNNVCQYEMPAANVTVNVYFRAINTYTITYSADSSGGSVSGPEIALDEDDVTFKVTPARGFKLNNVVATPEGGKPDTLTCWENQCIYQMPAKNVTVAASFKALDPRTITYYDPGIQGNMTYTIESAYPGDTVAFDAWANDGYVMDSLTVVYGSFSSGLSYTQTGKHFVFVMPETNVTVYASFSKLYKINVATVKYVKFDFKDKPSTLKYGENGIVFATADSLYEIRNFKVTSADNYKTALPDSLYSCGYNAGEKKENYCQITMPDYDIMVSADIGKKRNEITFVYGDSSVVYYVEYDQIPGEPWEFCSVDNSEYAFKCTWDKKFTVAAENTTYTLKKVEKTKKTYSIEVSVNDPAMGSVTGLSETGVYEYGSEVKITATAKSGYKFSNWDDDVKTAERTIKVTDNSEYTAIFKAVASSSSSAKAASSSSSAKAKSSSSVKSSSSSAKAKSSSSSKKGSKDAIVAATQVPMFSVTSVARELQIAGAQVGASYAVFDMQGRVMFQGRVDRANFSLAMPRAGTYMLRIAGQAQRVTLH